MELTIAGKPARVKGIETLNELKEFLVENPISDNATELEVRKALLPFVEHKLNTNQWMLYDGNTVWNVRRLTDNFKTFIKYYDVDHLTKYLYGFFHLQCGSIAHYNKQGWMDTYPTLNHLKEFFKGNEYGELVRSYPPSWHHDALKATDAMHSLLFNEDSQKHPNY